MTTLLQDIKFGARLLLKDPTFTVTALLTLAICIGANAAMFTVVRSVLLKPLPFPDSDRIVLLYNSYPNAGVARVGAAVPDYFDRQVSVPALDVVALFRREGVTFGDENGAERLNTLRVTPSFFRVARVSPVAGRVFSEEEGEPGKNQKALLSYGFWKRKFGASPSVIGTPIRLSGTMFDIVGVLPAEFTFLQNDVDLFVPAAFEPDDKSDDRRHSNNWQMIGHLREGANVDQVQQQVDALNAANDTKFPEFHQILLDARFRTVSVLLRDDVVRDIKKVLYLLWGGVGFVLILGCLNIANLVVVRASGRTREMATRHAIGGDLARLARQLVTETTLLALAGGAGGLALGWTLLHWLPASSLTQLPRGYEIQIDPIVIVVTLVLTVAVGVALGAAPASRLWRMKLDAELREETRGGTSGRRANRVRQALAIAQVAIALALLTGAGLLLASFRAVLNLDYGFDPAQVATANINLPGTTYKDPPALAAFEGRMLDGLRALPGVEAAGATTSVPFGNSTNYNVILAEGYVMKPGESLLAPMSVTVTSGYFESMHIPVVRGRVFDARDTASAPATVILDERLARKFWPEQDAIGHRLYHPDDLKNVTAITPKTEFFTVVGVVKEVQMVDPRSDFTPVGTYYFPYEQQASRGMTLTVRTRTASPSIQADIRRVIAGLDAQLPVFRAQPMQQWIDDGLVGRRLPMIIALGFGIVALLLSAIGIYGVLAYGVAQRRRELGMRMALGGTGSAIFWLVLFDGLKIVGIGVAIGLASSLGVGQIMKSQLFGVTPMSPLVLVVVTAGLSVVALVASAIPALRASRINPIVVLAK